MKHCVQDSAIGVAAAAVAETHPYCSITTAMFIIGHFGVGGGGFVRTPYVQIFYYAARKLNMRIGTKQCFRSGVSMHRITRVA